MARTRRTVLWIFAILAGVIILGVLVFAFLVPKDAVQEKVLAALEQKLGRPVSVGGVQISLLPDTRVRLEELVLGGEPRVSVRALDLEVELLPLLRRQVKVVRVELREPHIEMRLPEDVAVTDLARPAEPREMNAPETSPAREPSPPAARSGTESTPKVREPMPPLESPVDIQVESFAIRDGRIDVIQADGRPLVAVAGFHEDLFLSVTSQGHLELRGETRIDTIRIHLPTGTFGQDLPLSLSKSLAYDQVADELTIREADMRIGDLPVALTGTLVGLSAGAPRGELDLAGGPASVRSILGYLPAGAFPEMEGLRSEGEVTLHAVARGDLGGPNIPFHLEFHLRDGRVEHPGLRLPVEDLTVDLLADPDSVRIRRFSARSGRSRLTANAVVTAYTTSPLVDLTAEADVVLDEVSPLIAPPDSLTLAGRVIARISVRGPAENPEALGARGWVELQSLAVESPRMPMTLRDGRGRLRLEGERLAFEGIEARWGESDIHLDGTIDRFRAFDPQAAGEQTARLDLALRSDHLDLDALIPPESQEPPAGGEAGEVPPSAAAVAALLGRAEGRIGLEADWLRINRAEAREVRGTLRVQSGRVHLDDLTLRTFGGRLDLDGVLDFQEPQRPRFEVTARAQKVRASELYGYSVSLDRLSGLGQFLTGEIDATAEMRGDLDDALGLDLQSFASSGDLATQGARLSGHPLQNALAGFLDAPQLETLVISDWLQSFRIEDGRLNVDDLRIRADQVELTGSGWQSLDGKTEIALDVRLPRKLSAGVRRKIPSELAPILFDDSDERILLPINLGGTVSSPRVSFDTGRLRQAAQARAKQQLEQKARETVSGFLEDLIGGSESDSAGADSVGERQEDPLQNLLKGLFRK